MTVWKLLPIVYSVCGIIMTLTVNVGIKTSMFLASKSISRRVNIAFVDSIHVLDY
jgi:hypothetical protein